MSSLSEYPLFGIRFAAVSKDELILWIESRLEKQQMTCIATPNPEMVVESQHNPDFLRILQTMDLRTPDGIGILWATKFLTLPVRFTSWKRTLWTSWQVIYSLFSILFAPHWIRFYLSERISGSDLFWHMIELCHVHQKKPFFLGAKPGVAEIVREKVIARYPRLQVAGVFSGSPETEFDADILHLLTVTQADMVFVAYGAPKQEFWIQRIAAKLQKPMILIGVGGTFDFISGKKIRAPRIFRSLGLEWLFRLCIEPWRYIRIYTATFQFVKLVVKKREEKL